MPANHQETEYLSIAHSHVPSFWRRATSEVTVPLRLRVEVRARSPQMSAGRCSPNSNFRFSGPKPRNLEFSKKLVNGRFATQERSTANVDYRVWLEQRRHASNISRVLSRYQQSLQILGIVGRLSCR
jgi:hypothetical protein